LVGFERGEECWVEWDTAELAVFAVEFELAVGEVDLVPGEGGGLAEPKPGEGKDVEGDVLPRRSDRVVDRSELLAGVGGWFDVGQRREA